MKLFDKPLDVIACVDYGYRLAWVERGYFLRLAAVPLLVKTLCLLTTQQLGLDQADLRNVFVLLPSFFTEGWMLAHVARFVFHGQRWPFTATGNPAQDISLLAERAHGVMGGAVCYALTKFLLGGLFCALMAGTASTQQHLATGQATGDVASFSMLAAMLLTGATLWGFRFIYLYVPVAGGYGTRPIAQVPQSFLFSLQTVGISLVCYVPLVLLMVWLAGLFSSGGSAGLGLPVKLGFVLLQIMLDTAITIISTAAITFGLRTLMEQQEQAS